MLQLDDIARLIKLASRFVSDCFKGETILHDNLQEIETEISMAKHPEDILMLFV